MIALTVSAALFLFWAALGRSVLALLYVSRDALSAVLLAPVTGMAVTIIPVFLLNRAGLPVGSFALPLTLACIIVASMILVWLRPTAGLRPVLPIFATLALGLILIARPMLEFGFDWLSFANPDMANYVLGAHRMVDHGFFTVPSIDDMARGTDYTLFIWSFNVAVRPGSELLLAWAISLSGFTGHQIFMPLIVAQHLVLLCTAGALATQRDGSTSRLGALLVVLLLSTSALNALGTLAQLIAQVGGLSLLGATALLLLRTGHQEDWRNAVRFGLLLGILGSALYIVYPEVLPFLGVAWVAFHTVSMLGRRSPGKSVLIVFAAALPLAIAFLGTYIPVGLTFLSLQTAGGTAGNNLDSAFPFFLVPSGLANLWGLQPLSPLSGEPILSITILAGAMLCLIGIVGTTQQFLRLQPAAAIAAVMIGLFGYLFMARSDFGMFKLAMYLQPFLVVSLVMWILARTAPVTWRIAPLLLLAVGNVPVHTFYVERSRGMVEATSAFAEIPNGSASAINQELAELLRNNPVAHVISDTSNEVLAKFQAIYLRSRASSFPAKPFFNRFLSNRPEDDFSLSFVDAQLPEARQRLARTLASQGQDGAFRMVGIDGTRVATFDGDRARQAALAEGPDVSLVVTNANQSLFNRRWFGPAAAGNYALLPLGAISNHLIFVESDLGQTYFPPFLHDVGHYKLERDVMFPDQTMSALGRYLVLQVVNPTDKIRLLLSVTSTLKGDGENLLPPAAAVGEDRAEFGMIGRGAARLVSPPLSPQQIEGLSYVGLDLGAEASRFTVERTGLMRLYGTDVALDVRRLVTFGRDVSAISDEEYAKFQPPATLRRFPVDLQHPDLEFSGLYEDGWISEAAWMRLSQPLDADRLVIEGTIPLIDDPAFTSELTVLIDGEEVARRLLTPGEFALTVPSTPTTGVHRVELLFSRAQPLPRGDRRPAAAFLVEVGFRTEVNPSER